MNVRYPENIDREWGIEPDAGRLLFALELRESNPLECLNIFHELADRGSNLAKYYIGDSYANGRDVHRDIERGMQWYQNASDSGSIEASHRLVFWLWHNGQHQDAIEKLKYISERGFSPAMFLLGSIYYSDYTDHSIEKNVDLALKYWKLAEARGHLIAKRRISVYLRGKDSGIIDKLKGYLKLLRFLPAFMFFSIKHPTSDRLRGWNYGAGLGLR